MKITLSLILISLAVPLFSQGSPNKVQPVSQDEINIYQKKVSPTLFAKATEDCKSPKSGITTDECWRGYFASAAGEHPNVAPQHLGNLYNNAGKTCGNSGIFDKDCKPDVAVGPKSHKTSGNANSNTNSNTNSDANANANINTNTSTNINTNSNVQRDRRHRAHPDKPDDPNKWNNTIAGGKMAIWAALIGFVFGGPAGMMLFAAVGFGAGYFIKKIGG